jgi:hypothetical protein
MADEPDIVIDVAAEAVPLTAGLLDELDPLKSGFMWYKPPMATSKEHATGGHEWTISGNDMQILTSTVPAGEMVVTEIGSFMYMSPFMETKVELTLCSRTGCGEGWRRIFAGESCVKVLLINDSSEEGYVGITPGFPAKVIPVSEGRTRAGISEFFDPVVSNCFVFVGAIWKACHFWIGAYCPRRCYHDSSGRC